MPDIKYTTPSTLTTYETTNLDALAVDAALVGGTIGNVGGGENELFIAIELILGVTAARTIGDQVAVYLLPSLDDVNFSYGSSGGSAVTDPGNQLTILSVPSGTAQARIVRANLPLPPLDFQLQIVNRMGVAFGTLNTFNYRIYSNRSI